MDLKNLNQILLKNLTCPITYQIFRNPITLNDGITYEYDAVCQWLSTNPNSPINKDIKLVNTHQINIYLKNLIDELESNNIIDSNSRYRNCLLKKFKYFEFKKIQNIDEQKNYLDSCDLECEDNDNWRPIHYICRYSRPEMIKYIIDKGVELECETNNSWRPLHFICSSSTPRMIKYIINKGVDLECETDTNKKPVDLISEFSTPKMLEYINKKLLK